MTAIGVKTSSDDSGSLDDFDSLTKAMGPTSIGIDVPLDQAKLQVTICSTVVRYEMPRRCNGTSR